MPAQALSVPLLVRAGPAAASVATQATGPSATRGPQPVDTSWESLSDTQQSAAIGLGWSPETWADGLHVPPLSSGLSASQKLAVRELGYSSDNDWDQVPRGWVDAGSSTEEVEEPEVQTDWSGSGRSQQSDQGSTSSGATSGLRRVTLRLLAAILAGAALCVGAETAGVLPDDAPEPPKPEATATD